DCLSNVSSKTISPEGKPVAAMASAGIPTSASPRRRSSFPVFILSERKKERTDLPPLPIRDGNEKESFPLIERNFQAQETGAGRGERFGIPPNFGDGSVAIVDRVRQNRGIVPAGKIRSRHDRVRNI